MSKHEELIERLRASSEIGLDPDDAYAAADALEAQAREIEGLQAQLAATAKSAFEAMPHDIPRRMKRKICVETGWSMSMVSRAYIELRAAFTGEKYTANADLDAAMSEIEGLRKDAERYRWLREKPGADLKYGPEQYTRVCTVCQSYGEDLDAAIDAAKGAPHG